MTMVEMKVDIDCPGCQSKIRKALQKLEGVDEIDIDMDMQKVTVMGWADQEKVLKAVRRTRRTAELWPYPYNSEYLNSIGAYQQSYYNHLSQDQIQTLEAVPVSYNYIIDGYTCLDYGYRHQPPYPSLIAEKSEAMFSDDNPHACSIM